MHRRALGRKHLVEAGQLRPHALRERVLEAQPRHDLLRHFRGNGGVSVKVSDAVCILCKAFWLAKIVQEHRPAQHPRRRRRADRARRVLPHIVAMVRVALVEAHAGQDLRQHDAENIRVLQQHRRGVLPAQQLIQLRIHTLVRDGAQAVPPLPRGTRRVFLDRKAKHGREAQQAQNAERILGEASRRIAHAAQDARTQILPPAEGIDEPSVRRKCDGVHREVAAGKVLFDAACKAHALGVTAVAVGSVAALGRVLDGKPAAHERHRSVHQPGRVRVRAEEGHDLLRPCIARHVVVVRLRAAQQVAHAAADEVGRMAAFAQQRQHFPHRLRGPFHHAPTSPKKSVKSRRKKFFAAQKSALYFTPVRIILYGINFCNSLPRRFRQMPKAVGMCAFGKENAMDINSYLVPGKRAHLAGIGGVSMSPLAEVLHSMGLSVQGSDMNDSPAVEHLRALGIPVAIGHAADNLGDADFVVRTAAIHDDNPEISGAVARGIPVFERAQAWGAIMHGYRNALCISGTHGKTTTTSMATHIFMAADADPTVMIGGTLPLLHSGYRVGHGDTIIAESCEYCNSFLSFFPTVAVILNVEADHLDFFKDLHDVEHSFRRFAELVPADGHVVANWDDAGVRETLEGYTGSLFTFSERGADAHCHAENLVYTNGLPSFDVICMGQKYAHVALEVGGEHNVMNALAAASAAYVLGIRGEAVERGLATFTGAGRRFEKKGSYHGADVYDDYAHHPGELHALLTMAKALPYRRIVCAFQPHTYTRTKALFEEFVRELKLPDVLILAEIYAAREQNDIGISSNDLARRIPGAIYCPTLDKVTEALRAAAQPGDLIITVGAGDIYKAGEKLLREN